MAEGNARLQPIPDFLLQGFQFREPALRLSIPDQLVHDDGLFTISRRLDGKPHAEPPSRFWGVERYECDGSEHWRWEGKEQFSLRPGRAVEPAAAIAEFDGDAWCSGKRWWS